MWSDWLVVRYCSFSLSAHWSPLSVPSILPGFLLPRTWGLSSRLFQQSAAAATYLGCGGAPLGHCPFPQVQGSYYWLPPPDLGRGVAPVSRCPWPLAGGSSSVYYIIYSFVNGHLVFFIVFAIVNSAAVNIWVHVSFQIIVLSKYIPRSGIAGSCSNS